MERHKSLLILAYKSGIRRGIGAKKGSFASSQGEGKRFRSGNENASFSRSVLLPRVSSFQPLRAARPLLSSYCCGANLIHPKPLYPSFRLFSSITTMSLHVFSWSCCSINIFKNNTTPTKKKPKTREYIKASLGNWYTSAHLLQLQAVKL